MLTSTLTLCAHCDEPTPNDEINSDGECRICAWCPDCTHIRCVCP